MIKGADSHLDQGWIFEVKLERSGAGGGLDPMGAQATFILQSSTVQGAGLSAHFPIPPDTPGVQEAIVALESAIENAIAPHIWASHQKARTDSRNPGFVPTGAATIEQINQAAEDDEINF